MTQRKSNRKKLSLDNRKDKTKAELCETKAELRQKHIKVGRERTVCLTQLETFSLCYES